MPVYVLLLLFLGGPDESPQLVGTLLDEGKPVIFHTLEDCKALGMALARDATERFVLRCTRVGFDA